MRHHLSDEPPDSLAVRVESSLTGVTLATLRVGLCWRVDDIVPSLDEALPGHEYKFMLGDRLLEPSESLEALLPDAGEDDVAELRLSVVVSRLPNAQAELDKHLIKAAERLDLEFVRRLLAAGASAEYVDDPFANRKTLMQNQRTALHEALSAQGDAEAREALIKLLLSVRADVNVDRVAIDHIGAGYAETPLAMLSLQDAKDARLFRLFLDAGADPDLEDYIEVHSPGTHGVCVKRILHSSVEIGNLDVASALLEARAEVNAFSTDVSDSERVRTKDTAETALHCACTGGNVSMAALLLQHCADVDQVRQHLQNSVLVRETSLHLAAAAGHALTVALLIRAGADASLRRTHGEVATSTEDLCGSDAKLCQALQAASWSQEEMLEFFSEEDVRGDVEAARAAFERRVATAKKRTIAEVVEIDGPVFDDC